MESSQSLKILLDMLREELTDKLGPTLGRSSNSGATVDEIVSNALEALRANLLDKFELVVKADYEAQAALVANMRAQLLDLEQRLAALEQQQANRALGT